jgi:hypothetical protein
MLIDGFVLPASQKDKFSIRGDQYPKVRELPLLL